MEFLAAQSSSRSLVVRWSVRPSDTFVKKGPFEYQTYLPFTYVIVVTVVKVVTVVTVVTVSSKNILYKEFVSSSKK